MIFVELMKYASILFDIAVGTECCLVYLIQGSMSLSPPALLSGRFDTAARLQADQSPGFLDLGGDSVSGVEVANPSEPQDHDDEECTSYP